MEYKLLMVRCAGLAGTHFEKAAEQLAAQVNGAIQEGWRPQGGVCVGESQMTREPYLMQAVVRG